MYLVKETRSLYNTEPWRKNYEDRINVLREAKKRNENTVAYLYPEFDSSTFRYRGYNTCETLEYSLLWKGMYFENVDIEKLLDEIDCIDVLICIRVLWDESVDKLISAMHSHNKPVCYDVDDLIYDTKYINEVIPAIDLTPTHYTFWLGTICRYNKVIRQCDSFITTNEYLAKYISNDFDGECYILKNYLNWIQIDVSDNYFSQKKQLESEDAFVLGYFSGSPTHVKDLLVAMPYIERLLCEYNDIELHIVGYMDLPSKYNKWIENKRIQYIPFQSFVGLQYEQAKVDVNIVPLYNNIFSNCKSELKYFESAVVGTPTCATPSFTYAKAIKDGVNGFLCESEEWYDKIKNLYLNRMSIEKKEFIRNKAIQEYSSENQIHYLENVLFSIRKGLITNGSC